MTKLIAEINTATKDVIVSFGAFKEEINQNEIKLTSTIINLITSSEDFPKVKTIEALDNNK